MNNRAAHNAVSVFWITRLCHRCVTGANRYAGTKCKLQVGKVRQDINAAITPHLYCRDGWIQCIVGIHITAGLSAAAIRVGS